MRNIKILVDSCADLTKELLEKYDIDYARMNIIFKEKEYLASLSWEEYSPHDIYDYMRNKGEIKTTPVPEREYNRIFNKYISEGYDIVYIGCSTKQTPSVFLANDVAKKVMEENKEVKIYCIDSLNACIGEGMLGIYASMLVKKGFDIDEIYNAIIANRNKVLEFSTVHSLEYLRRCGRVKSTAAFFGDLMGVKPILIADADGEQTPIKKINRRKKSLDEIVDLLKEKIVNPENQTIYVAHADCDNKEVNYVVNLVRKRINCMNIEIVPIGPIIGASVGPDTIGVFAFGEEVTYRVSANN